LLNRTRALENQAFLFSCNGVGSNCGVGLGGHSVLVDPLGEVLAEEVTVRPSSPSKWIRKRSGRCETTSPRFGTES